MCFSVHFPYAKQPSKHPEREREQWLSSGYGVSSVITSLPSDVMIEMTRHVILDQELLQARDTKGYKAASWWKINRQGGKRLLINLVLCEKGGSCWYRIAIKDGAISSDSCFYYALLFIVYDDSHIVNFFFHFCSAGLSWKQFLACSQ